MTSSIGKVKPRGAGVRERDRPASTAVIIVFPHDRMVGMHRLMADRIASVPARLHRDQFRLEIRRLIDRLKALGVAKEEGQPQAAAVAIALASELRRRGIRGAWDRNLKRWRKMAS